mgnify:CR=1 FL=1
MLIAILNKHRFLKLVAGVLFLAVFLLSLLANSSAQTVLQGYGSDEKLQRGMLVALKEGDESKVVALTDKTVEKFKGVIVEQNDSPVTISNDDRKNFVATVGPYEVLVSNENGPIKKGNYVSLSSTSGIGALATENQKFVIGVATSDFTGSSDSLTSASNTAGRKAEVGRITVDVAFGKNPNARDPAESKVPAILKKVSESIADKPVNTVRIYISLAIFLAAAAVTGTMLFSGVRSAVVAIGRNPLSKSSIYRGLLQVVILALIIFLVGIFGVYLVLKL